MTEVDLHAALHSHINFPAFRPGQEAALQHLLRGQHTLVVMPTGSGKLPISQLAALPSPASSASSNSWRKRTAWRGTKRNAPGAGCANKNDEGGV